MASQAKELCLSFAKSSNHVRGLVLLGSFAVQQQCDSSDLDILFVLKPEVVVEQYQDELCTIFENVAKGFHSNRDEDENKQFVHNVNDRDFVPGVDCSTCEIVSYECDVRSADKTIIYVGCSAMGGNRYLKIDCGHTSNVMNKAKYIIGSEVKLRHLPHVVLLDYDGNDGESRTAVSHQPEKIGTNVLLVDQKVNTKGHIYYQLHAALESKDPYDFTGLRDNDPTYHIHRFVELFDNCCNSVEKRDVYRAEFHMFLLRHSLHSLELLLDGEHEHIYLPKMLHKRVDVISITTSNTITILQTLLNRFQLLELKIFDEKLVKSFNCWCAFLEKRFDELVQVQAAIPHK